MRRPLSLISHLTLLFGLAAAGIFVAFGWIISHSTELHFAAGDTRELKIIAQTVEDALVDVIHDEDLNLLASRFNDILIGHHSASLYVINELGELIFVSPGPDLSAMVASASPDYGELFTNQWQDAESSYRVLVQKTAPTRREGHRYTIAVAVPINFHLQFMNAFRQTLWLTVVVSIIVMSLVGWIAVRRSHAPLHQIVERIGQTTANKLTPRLNPEALPSDLTDLAVSFNDMLQRVDDAFQKLSDFSSDIAHELRTPVTNMLTQAQVALTRSRSIEEYREILYSNVEEYERMAQMISDMLFMAKADNGMENSEIAEIDLATEVRNLFDYYDGWAEERHVGLSLEGDAIVSADRGMLRRALANLLSNAIGHTPSGQRVQVILNTSPGAGTNITIENPGTDIPPEHLPKLFDRFHRVDPSRQRDGDGAGLGLAIVKAIIEAHKGDVRVTSNAGLTRFTIRLPNVTPISEVADK